MPLLVSLLCDKKVGKLWLWHAGIEVGLNSVLHLFWWGQRQWHHSLDTTTTLNCVWQGLFVHVHLSVLVFLLFMISFYDLIMFPRICAFLWSLIITREWTNPFDMFLKLLHTFAPYLANEGSCFSISPYTKCLVILKSLLMFLPDVNNVMYSWYYKPLTHSGQSRTFTHLKTVLDTLMNACREYDLQSAWYWENRELLANIWKPLLLRINPQSTFSPVWVHIVSLHCSARVNQWFIAPHLFLSARQVPATVCYHVDIRPL